MDWNRAGRLPPLLKNKGKGRGGDSLRLFRCIYTKNKMTKKQIIQQNKIATLCAFVCGLGLGLFAAVVAFNAGGLL